MIDESGFEAQAGRIIVSGYSGAAYALRLNSRAGTEGSMVSSLICDRWLILGLETLSISRLTTDGLRSSMALFTRTAKLDPGAHGARCTSAMAVHHAVGISCQRNVVIGRAG